jgi:putative hydrolase of the HAD superfamily
VSRYEGVLLDANGTLVHLDRPVARLRAALRARGVRVPAATAERALHAEMTHYVATCDRGRDAASLRRLRADCARVLAGELGPKVGAGIAADALGEALVFRPYADARPLLAELRRRGVHTAIVSNWDCSLDITLAAARLEVDAVVTCAGAGARKPDPAIFEAALRRIGVPAAAALHVGDRPELDGVGARAAGIDVRILDRAAVGPRAGTIAALTDVLELL